MIRTYKNVTSVSMMNDSNEMVITYDNDKVVRRIPEFTAINKEPEIEKPPKFRDQQEKHRVFHTITAIEKNGGRRIMGLDELKDMVSANTGVPKSLLEEEKDNINPDHYKSSTSLECIEAMDIVFGNIFVTNFCIGNAWKYIWRWKHKNGLEDLEKAKWYAEKAKHDILHGSCDHREKDKLLMIVNRILDYIEVNNCPEQDGDKR